MRIAFFMSSLGDTDLAKATAIKLTEQSQNNLIFLIPLTAVAKKRTEDMIGNNQIFIVPIENITEGDKILSRNQILSEELKKVLSFIEGNNIQHAYMGVPSSDNEIPLQIAESLEISCTIAYEYMFKPNTHIFWNYVNKLGGKKNCDFAVPLMQAKTDILSINPDAKVHEIGHLSIDRSQIVSNEDFSYIKKSLSVGNQDELVFISGTTQSTEVDNQFLQALLSEISTGKYPNLQFRMGLHPGVSNPDAYLQTLLKTCENYPTTISQFKIVLTTQFENKLQQPLLSTSFILRSDVSGTEMAQAADKVAQAVPGALLNEAALKGKPSYFHDHSARPYLPKAWFSESIISFFNSNRVSSHTKEELGIEDNAPKSLTKLCELI